MNLPCFGTDSSRSGKPVSVTTNRNHVHHLLWALVIHGLIGGFHLFNKSEEEVRNVARNILDTGIDYVCTGHCTKDRAYGIMKEILGDRLQQLHVGLIVEF